MLLPALVPQDPILRPHQKPISRKFELMTTLENLREFQTAAQGVFRRHLMVASGTLPSVHESNSTMLGHPKIMIAVET